MIKGEKFEGNPCAKCGSTLRYVIEKRCVYCTNLSKAKYAASERGKIVKKKAMKKHYDLKTYGACTDNEKTQRRRDAEERLLNKELGLC